MIAIPLGPFKSYNSSTPRRALTAEELSYCINTDILNNVASKSYGWLPLKESGTAIALDTPARHIAEHVTSAGNRYICILTKNSFYVYDSANANLIDYTRTGDPYADTYQWSSTSFGDLFIFTNGADEVQSWDGSTTDPADDLNTGWTIRPKVVLTFGAHLLLANDAAAAADSVERKAVIWSGVNNPTVIDSGTDATAGQLYVYEGQGEIVGLATLVRDVVAVYKTGSIHSIEYVGAPDYWVVRSSLTGIGVWSPSCMATIGVGQVVVADSGIYVYNGADVTPLGPEIDSVLSSLYPNNNAKYVQVVYDPSYTRLWIMLPNSGTNWTFGAALVFNIKDKTWSLQNTVESYAVGVCEIADAADKQWQDFPIAWESSSDFWAAFTQSTRNKFIIGDTSTGVHYEDSLTMTRFSNNYVSQIETSMINPGKDIFDAPVNKSELVKIDVGLESGSPDVYVGTSENGDGNITWVGPYTLTSGSLDVCIVGRWFIFRLESTSQFTVSHITPWFVKRGSV